MFIKRLFASSYICYNSTTRNISLSNRHCKKSQKHLRLSNGIKTVIITVLSMFLVMSFAQEHCVQGVPMSGSSSKLKMPLADQLSREILKQQDGKIY